MRDLVETVTVSRDASRPGGVEAHIAGRLNALLGAQDHPNGVKGAWLNDGSGGPLLPIPRQEDATFSLKPHRDQEGIT